MDAITKTILKVAGKEIDVSGLSPAQLQNDAELVSILEPIYPELGSPVFVRSLADTVLTIEVNSHAGTKS